MVVFRSKAFPNTLYCTLRVGKVLWAVGWRPLDPRKKARLFLTPTAKFKPKNIRICQALFVTSKKLEAH